MGDKLQSRGQSMACPREQPRDFFFHLVVLVGGLLLYNIVVVLAIH